jgi:TRAP-type C4-dicarboxylate transport system substrate-binding protein
MTTRTRNSALLLTVAASVAGLAAGCTAAPAASEGFEPQTLTLFHIDGNLDIDPAVGWFIDAVTARSDGAVTVEVTSECCGKQADVEEVLVSAVAAGEADLGWVGTRVFAEMGVDGLRALNAPLLIDGYALQRAVLESTEATEALAGVSELGVTPLALVPGSIRYPLAADEPVDSLADWSGLTIASFHSTPNADALSALGAQPLDVGFEERDAGLYDGTIGALENSLLLQDLGREETVPYATVDVALWPRTSALIADPESAAASGPIADLLRQAAADAVAATKDLSALDVEAMAAACADGARFALAGTSELAAMRAAVQSEHDAISEIPQATALMEAVIAFAETHDPEVPAIPDGCDGAGLTTQAVQAGDPSVVNGRFQTVAYTEQQLLDAGLPPDAARNGSAQFTLVFVDGAFELIADDDGQIFGCEGEYTVSADVLVIDYYPGGDCGPGGEFLRATFTVDQSALTLTEVEAAFESDEYLFGSAPLTRVG